MCTWCQRSRSQIGKPINGGSTVWKSSSGIHWSTTATAIQGSSNTTGFTLLVHSNDVQGFKAFLCPLATGQAVARGSGGLGPPKCSSCPPNQIKICDGKTAPKIPVMLLNADWVCADYSLSPKLPIAHPLFSSCSGTNTQRSVADPKTLGFWVSRRTFGNV